MLDRALSLANEGDNLIEASHYAEDSIQPKCSEVRAVGENVRSHLQAQKDHLLKALELHRCLDRVRGQHTHSQCVVPALFCCLFSRSSLSFCPLQASKWVDDGIYLLASQPVDKCLSQDGAELALQELERYLDSASQNQLTDLSTITREYEAVLNQQFRVRTASGK